MKNRIVIISKQIHGSFAAMSSDDKTVYFKTTEKKIGVKLQKGKVINEKVLNNFPFLKDEEIVEVSEDKILLNIYLKSDKTIYNILKTKRGFLSSSEKDKETLKQLVESYLDKGFQTTKFPKERTLFFQRESLRGSLKRKEEGYVLWKKHGLLTSKDYQGGFSDEIFNTKEMQDYVKGSAFGWIGHLVRKPEHDALIEKGLRKRGLTEKQMFNWISSKNGRHFGDSLEEYNKLEDQLKIIEKLLNSIYNLAIIYEDKRYTKSTREVRALLEKEGKLLPE